MNTFSPLKSTPQGLITLENLKGYLKFLLFTAAFLCFIAIGLLVLGIFYIIQISWAMLILHASVSGLAIILAVMTLIWGAKARSLLKKDKITGGGLALLIYQTGLIIMVFWIFSSINVILTHKMSIKNILPFKPDADIDSISTQLDHFVIWLIILTIFGLICVGYIVYVAFLCSRSSDNHKNSLNVWCLAAIIFSGLGMVFYQAAKNQDALRNVKAQINQHVLDFGLATCILAGGMALIGYIINLGKWRRPYIFFGGAFIWVVVIALLAAGFNYRMARGIYSTNLEKCSQNMHWTSKDQIQSFGCSKYETVEIAGKTYPSVDCKSEGLGEVWEEQEKLKIDDKTRKFTCVNEKCCGIISTHYSNYFFAFSACLLGIFLTSFLAISATFSLAEKADIHEKAKAKDFVIGALIILGIIAISILAIYSNTTPSFEKPMVVSLETEEPEKVGNNYKMRLNPNPKLMKDYPANFCEPFKKLYTSFSTIDDDLKAKTTSVYRLVVLATGGDFRLPRDYNSKAIFRFSKDKYRLKYFPNSQDSDAFEAFQGKVDDVKVFLDSDFKFCYSPDKPYTFTVHRYYKPDQTTPTSFIGDLEMKKESNPNLHFPKDSANEFTEIPPESNWAKIYDDKFTDLIIQTYNILGYQPVPNVVIRVFKGIQPCVETHETAFRVIYSDITGKAKFNNLAQQHYTILVDRKDFKSNCAVIKNLENRRNYHFKIAMLPEFKEEKEMAVLLTYTQSKAELLLHSTFNFDDKIICSSNAMNGKCGGMRFEKRQNSQVIAWEEIGIYEYLFYVQRVPKSKEQKNVLSKSLGGETVELSEVNKELEDSEASVKVFVQNLVYPVLEARVPGSTDAESKDPNQIWLIGCMDGRIGPASIKEINKFWTKAQTGTTPAYWNKVDNSFLPNSKICDSLYKTTTI